MDDEGCEEQNSVSVPKSEAKHSVHTKKKRGWKKGIMGTLGMLLNLKKVLT